MPISNSKLSAPSVSSQPRRILRFPAVAAITGLGRTTIYRLMKEGQFPQMIHINGGPCAGWDSDAINEWVKAQLEGNRDEK